MKRGIGSDVKSSGRKIAQQAAKQIAQEPLEMLKAATRQTSGRKVSESIPETSEEVSQEQILIDEAKEKTRSKKILDALEVEMEDIRRQKKLKEEERLQESKTPKTEEEKPLQTVSSKRPRGMKGKIERLKTKAEIRMPPSG